LTTIAKSNRPGFLVLVAATVIILAAACSGSDGRDPNYPIRPTNLLVEEGRVVYEANCASCHGDSTTPPPLPNAPNHTEDGHTWHHGDRLLVEFVLDGPSPERVMPRFKYVLTEAEIRAAIAYIKTFWPDDIVKRQIKESETYEKNVGK